MEIMEGIILFALVAIIGEIAERIIIRDRLDRW